MLDDGEPGRTDWKDLIQLAETIDVSPSLLATQQLVGKIVAGEVSGKFAVDTAKVLQRQGLLEPRLFVSAVLKVKLVLYWLSINTQLHSLCSLSPRYLWK